MKCLLALPVLLGVLSAADPKPASWPQFRGPSGAAVGDDDARFPTQFGPD